MKFKLIAPAVCEFEEALIWYEAQSPNLKARLLQEFETAQERILEHPGAWHPLGGGLRRYRLDRFPYGLIYRIDPQEIVIIAIAHLHRSPDYWRDRLSKI